MTAKRISESNHILLSLVKHKLEENGNAIYQFDGGSMQPLIHSGAKVKVEKRSDYVMGEIVLIELEKKLALHRIVAEDMSRKKRFLIKGDSNFETDGYFNNDEILGKATEIYYGNDKPLKLETRKSFFTNRLFSAVSLSATKLPVLLKAYQLFYLPVVGKLLYKILF